MVFVLLLTKITILQFKAGLLREAPPERLQDHGVRPGHAEHEVLEIHPGAEGPAPEHDLLPVPLKMIPVDLYVILNHIVSFPCSLGQPVETASPHRTLPGAVNFLNQNNQSLPFQSTIAQEASEMPLAK